MIAQFALLNKRTLISQDLVLLRRSKRHASSHGVGGRRVCARTVPAKVDHFSILDDAVMIEQAETWLSVGITLYSIRANVALAAVEPIWAIQIVPAFNLRRLESADTI